MTNTALKAQIDSQITNETLPNSVSPTDVGGNLKAVVDYVDQQAVQIVLKKTITHAELLDMSTTPIVLLTAVADVAYIPSAILLKFNNNGGFGDGGTTFNVNIKNDTNSTTLGSFASQLGGTSNLEQFRTLTSGSPTNIPDSFFNRRVELSTATNPSSPVDNTTTITVFLVYTKLTA
jgi:hypothetical protein